MEPRIKRNSWWLVVVVSPYGVRAVLARKDSWKCEAPIAFASQTLGPEEQNYAQLERNELVEMLCSNDHKSLAVQLSVILLCRPQRL